MKKHRQEITIERKIEIELELKKIFLEQKEEIELNNKLSMSELVYYIEAIKMPCQEILDALKLNDSSTTVDSIKLVKEMSQKYNVDIDDIINRIQDIRRINLYLTESMQKDVKPQKIYFR